MLHPPQQHGFVVEESRRRTDLSVVQIFHQLNTFGITGKAKNDEDTPELMSN